MAKYKKYDYNQTVLLPLALSDQLQPGTLEFYINMIVEEKIDLSVFDTKYNNDDNGSPAYDPKILLKIRIFWAAPIFLWTDANCLRMPQRVGAARLQNSIINEKNWKNRSVN